VRLADILGNVRRTGQLLAVDGQKLVPTTSAKPVTVDAEVDDVDRALGGVAPLPASSGKTSGRHRLNRGGDRYANCALWRVVIVRLATDAPTKHYMARRTQEGMSKPEIIRCLMRYVARQIYRELQPRAALASAA
jgi:transposase